ncbi:hypothetical protein [Nitrosopumilus sp.]|uniref:hypothetical protein n=1 Tax=Nitrosopumilus sp. TaxID=2024843 RepID=UPI003D12CB15
MKDGEDEDLRKELDEAKERIKNLERPSVNDYKSQGTTLVLSILLGLIGILGIGHIYVGKKKRGVLILVGGLFLVWIILMLTVGAAMIYGSTPLAGYIATANSFVPLYLIPFLALYIWQIIDSKKQCKAYNEALEKRN